MNDAPFAGRQPRHEPLFPGNPRGTFSEMLAHFIDAIVLPHVDVRSTCTLRPSGMRRSPPTPLRARPAMREDAGSGGGVRRALQRRVLGRRRRRNADVGGRAARHLSLGTELGGWGRVNVEGVGIADRGLQNIMRLLA